MKNNGFVFVETIVVIVVLTSALLLLYSSFNKILQLEKTRVYYDDIAYIYRTWHIKNQLEEININSVLKDISSNDKKYFATIGIEYQNLFSGYEHKKNYINKLLNDYEVNHMIVVRENKIDDLKACTIDSEEEYCNNLYLNLSDEMINYFKTIYIDVSCTYVLVVEYRTCNSSSINCKNYYSWVSV